MKVSKIIFLRSAVAIIVIMLSGWYWGANAKSKATTDVNDIISATMLKSIMDNSRDTIIVLDLYAPWCRPCRLLSPRIDSLAAKYRKQSRFYRINIDKLPDVAAAFGVQGIPYVVFIKNKKVFTALTGLYPFAAYEKVVIDSSSPPLKHGVKSAQGHN
jgi:thioredoxin